MIIGLAGRISSGKRELCNILEKQGFKRLYFALPLKTLLVTLLRLPNIQRLDELKNTYREYTFMEGDYNFIAKETGIPLNFIKNKMEGIQFTTVRQLMQYIGTDIIREYDENWHVKKLQAMLQIGQNYVFDDLRFPNEKQFIEENFGDTWYICRPKLDNVSNHISETSLRWQDFGMNVIINDKSLETLKYKWETFTEGYADHMAHREGAIEMYSNERDSIDSLADPFLCLDMLMLNKDLFSYKERKWNREDISSYELDDSNNLIIVYNDETSEYVRNKLNIEDFKMLIT